MHRGFKYYYREGLKTSAKTIYGNKCFFRYILYTLVEFFGRASIIFNPFFSLANMRQAYIIRKTQKLSLSSSFGSSGRWSAFGTYLLTLIFEGLIAIAGTVAIVTVGAVLGGIGFGVGQMANANSLLYVSLFAAPAVIILALFYLIFALVFSPTAYIILNNEGITAGEVIGACYKSMINSGKMTVFWTYFVSYLLKLIYLTVLTAIGAAIFWFTPNKYLVLVMIVFGVIMVVGYLTFAPILNLANRVAREHLYEDIVLDPVTASKVNEKVNLAVCKGKSVKTENLSQDLASLFDYTEDPYKILEATTKKQQLIVENKAVKKAGKNKSSGKVAPERRKPVRRPAEVKAPLPKEAKEKVAVDVAPSIEEIKKVEQPEAAPKVEVQPEAVAKAEVQPETIKVEAQPEKVPVVEAHDDITANQPLN